MLLRVSQMVAMVARRAVLLVLGVVAVLGFLPSSSADAKTPGKTYCFNGICHRVNTIAEMVKLVGRDTTFKTSFYDDCKRDRFNPCGLTSSGEVFRPGDADNVASPIYPNGTVLLLRNPDNGKSAVVRVNNAGPYWGRRKLDVSRGVAEKLGFKKRGVASLQARVVSAPTVADAKYKKNRRYNPVPGAIGAFASLDQAQGGMMVAMALDAMSGSVFAPAAGKMLPALKTAQPALVQALRFANMTFAAADPAVFGLSPADALKATARRIYGTDPERLPRRLAPASLTADATSPLARFIAGRVPLL